MVNETTTIEVAQTPDIPETTEARSREELINEALKCAAHEARKLFTRYRGRIPAEMTVGDLESIGHEALLEAYATWDVARAPWLVHARLTARFRIRKHIAEEVRRAGRRRSLHDAVGVGDDGELLLPADPRAQDPAALASAREVLRPRRGSTRGHSVTLALASLPEPEAVAAQVQTLRRAMFDAVKAEDVAAVMGTLVGKAKAGDLKATQMLVTMIGAAPTPRETRAVRVDLEDVS